MMNFSCTCVEHTRAERRQIVEAASSPRSRGTSPGLGDDPPLQRFIPALAGNTG